MEPIIISKDTNLQAIKKFIKSFFAVNRVTLEQCENLSDILADLSDREERFICMSCGLDNGIPAPNEEVAKALGVSLDTLKDIEASAVIKLHHPNRRRRLLENKRGN